MRLFVSTLRKLVRRPATWVTFGLLAGLLILIMLAVAATAGQGDGGPGGGRNGDPLQLVTFPGAYALILSFILGLGGLFAVLYGAAIAGSEWTWGTLKTVVARGESRSHYILATFAGVAVVMLVGLLVTFAIGVAGAALGATIAGVSLAGMNDATALGELPELMARGAVGMITQGAIGFTVATLARSQLAGIGVGIAVYFGGTFAGIFLPDVVRFLPFQLADTALGAGAGFGGGPPDAGALSADTALLLLVIWFAGALAVAAGFSERAEITG
jgi:ABC-type transport system involved in multi-copper enzyme maturation permease subunit